VNPDSYCSAPQTAFAASFQPSRGRFGPEIEFSLAIKYLTDEFVVACGLYRSDDSQACEAFDTKFRRFGYSLPQKVRLCKLSEDLL
jgi:hypothetical protein